MIRTLSFALLFIAALPTFADDSEDRVEKIITDLGGRCGHENDDPKKPVVSVHFKGVNVPVSTLAQLKAFKKLTLLSFNQTGLTDQGVKELPALKGVLTLALTRESKVTAGGIRSLASMTQLMELTLIGKNWTDAHLNWISSLTDLRNLQIIDANITDEGAKQMDSLKTVVSLSLQRANLTDVGVKSFARMEALKDLSLPGTKVTDAATADIAKHRHLEWLDLAETDISDAGLERLAALDRLKFLYLTSTRVSDAGLKPLFGLKQLRLLNVSHTKVTEAGIRELRKALPHCKVSR